VEIPGRAEIGQRDQQAIELTIQSSLDLDDAAQWDFWAAARRGVPMCSVVRHSGQSQRYRFYSLSALPSQKPEEKRRGLAHRLPSLITFFAEVQQITQPHAILYTSENSYILPMNFYTMNEVDGFNDAIAGIHLAVGHQPGSKLRNNVVKLYRPSGHLVSFDLCPISGRMAVVEDGRIVVSQYVS